MQPLKRNKIPYKHWPWLLVAVVALIAGFARMQPGTVVAESEGVNKVEACAECHDELTAQFKNQAHAVIDIKGLASMAGAESSCESCHGDGAKHIEEGSLDTIFSFKTGSMANQRSQNCLACHKDSKAAYFAGPHGKASMDCTACHSIHAPHAKASLLKTKAVKACHDCHQDVYAKFALNERHRLKEGTLTCSNCHDPHEPAATARLAGFKQETCFECHTDKQGPFLFEHHSVRVEGCTACHDVHGSPNRHMLIDQSVSQLCYSCHTHVPGWHSRFTTESNCVSCHNTIHGSNLSPKFLK